MLAGYSIKILDGEHKRQFNYIKHTKEGNTISGDLKARYLILIVLVLFQLKNATLELCFNEVSILSI